jgi:hypothetical protein
MLHELHQARGGEGSAGGAGGGQDPVAKALAQTDAFGYTPRQLALALGRARVAELLGEAEAGAGLDSRSAAAGALPGFAGGPAAASSAPLERAYAAGAPAQRFFLAASGALIRTNEAAVEEVGAGAGERAGEGEGVGKGAAEEALIKRNGGWPAPVYLQPLARAAVAAAERLLHAHGGSDACDIDVVDFGCRAGAGAGVSMNDAFLCVDDAAANATLSAHDFLRRFVVPARPVLLRGLARRWPVRRAWRRAGFERRHGHLMAEASEIPYARGFGAASAHLPLSRYVARSLLCSPALARGAAAPSAEQAAAGLDAAECAFLFEAPAGNATSRRDVVSVGGDSGREDASDDSMGAEEEALGPGALYVFNRIGDGGGGLGELAADMTALPWFLRSRLPVAVAPGTAAGDSIGVGVGGEFVDGPNFSLSSEPAPQFYLGAPGTGAPQHYGQDSFNVLAHGAKLWYLVPPERAEYSTVSAARFFAHDLPRAEAGAGERERPLVCAQRSGDVFFVPNGWGHAVLNLRTSIGYAVELSSLLHAYY